MSAVRPENLNRIILFYRAKPTEGERGGAVLFRSLYPSLDPEIQQHCFKSVPKTAACFGGLKRGKMMTTTTMMMMMMMMMMTITERGDGASITEGFRVKHASLFLGAEGRLQYNQEPDPHESPQSYLS